MLVKFFDTQWFFVLIFAAALLGWELKKRVGTAAALLVFYLAMSAIYVGVLNGNRYRNVPPYGNMALKWWAEDSLMKLLLVITPLLLAGKEWLERRGEWLVRLYCYGNCLYVAFDYAVRGKCLIVNTCGGLGGNPSMSMSGMVAMLPIAYRDRRDCPLLALSAAAIWLSGSSIALGMFGLFLALRLAWSGWWKLSLASIPAALAVGYVKLGGIELFNTSDRAVAWFKFIKALGIRRIFNQDGKLPTEVYVFNNAAGMGFGTFGIFSLNLQSELKFETSNWWYSLHSDWLQMIFEAGAIGFILMLLTYTDAALRSEGRRLQAVLLAGVLMLLNYPLHHAVSALFLGWLFALALRREGPHTTLKNYQPE